MRKVILSFYFVLAAGLSMFNAGCYAHVNGEGAGVGVEVVHDQRWHYDHDYDDDWRAHHPWHEDRHDWDH